jgi:formylglycine-generating enzyme required for sulfatase activity
MQEERNMNRKVIPLIVALAPAVAVLIAESMASAQPVTIQTVPVGNPGNAADPSTGLGSVAYSYNIGEYDVTAGQYTAFLNAVASTSDPYGLYNLNMSAAESSNQSCGITQSGSPGNYMYTATRDPNYPVNFATWGDAARFCNWLTNNEPSGAEGNGTTETGSYTLNGATSDAALMAITRNANADYVIPALNEWYKAGYYDPSSSSYYLYPTQSNSPPSNVLSATGTNNANYALNFSPNPWTDPTNYLTPVGAFAASPSAYGTYDQGGDVVQWNEATYSGSYRGCRGGSFIFNIYDLQSDDPNYDDRPSDVNVNIGFRVAQVPEPASVGILALGLSGMLLRWRGARR